MSIKGWTVIFRGQRLQAELLRAILEADGIRAELFSDTAYGIAIDFTDARLLVPDDQAGHARRLIREAEEAPDRGDELDEDEAAGEDV